MGKGRLLCEILNFALSSICYMKSQILQTQSRYVTAQCFPVLEKVIRLIERKLKYHSINDFLSILMIQCY